MKKKRFVRIVSSTQSSSFISKNNKLANILPDVNDRNPV